MYRCSEDSSIYVTGIGGLMVPETPRWLDSVIGPWPSPYRWVGIARQDCSYEPEPATPRLGAYQLPVRP